MIYYVFLRDTSWILSTNNTILLPKLLRKTIIVTSLSLNITKITRSTSHSSLMIVDDHHKPPYSKNLHNTPYQIIVVAFHVDPLHTSWKIFVGWSLSFSSYLLNFSINSFSFISQSNKIQQIQLHCSSLFVPPNCYRSLKLYPIPLTLQQFHMIYKLSLQKVLWEDPLSPKSHEPRLELEVEF